MTASTTSRNRLRARGAFSTGLLVVAIAAAALVTSAPVAGGQASAPSQWDEPETPYAATCTDAIKVMFINGVWNPTDGIVDTRGGVADLMSLLLPNRYGNWTIEPRGQLLYNSSNWYLADLEETFALQIRERIAHGDGFLVPMIYSALARVLDLSVDAAITSFESASLVFSSILTGSTPATWSMLQAEYPQLASVVESIAQKWADDHAAELGQGLPGGADLLVTNYVERVRERLADHQRVLLVAHSEGNLFANAVWDQLSGEERAEVRILHVAPPTNYLGTPARPHLLIDQDLVINNPLLAHPVANLDVGGRASPSYHAWRGSYLNYNASRDRIHQQSKTLIESVGTGDADPPIGSPLQGDGSTVPEPVAATVRAEPVGLAQQLGAPADVVASWHFAGGDLPPGITGISSDGTFQGEPTEPGTYRFKVEACGANSTDSHWRGKIIDVEMTVSESAGAWTPPEITSIEVPTGDASYVYGGGYVNVSIRIDPPQRTAGDPPEMPGLNASMGWLTDYRLEYSCDGTTWSESTFRRTDVSPPELTVEDDDYAAGPAECFVDDGPGEVHFRVAASIVASYAHLVDMPIQQSASERVALPAPPQCVTEECAASLVLDGDTLGVRYPQYQPCAPVVIGTNIPNRTMSVSYRYWNGYRSSDLGMSTNALQCGYSTVWSSECNCHVSTLLADRAAEPFGLSAATLAAHLDAYDKPVPSRVYAVFNYDGVEVVTNEIAVPTP